MLLLLLRLSVRILVSLLLMMLLLLVRRLSPVRGRRCRLLLWHDSRLWIWLLLHAGE